jgi:prevent-host-death family protein
MQHKTWTVAEAKAKFSELLETAQRDGPQTITKNGRTAAMLVSPEEWERKAHRSGSLADFFARSPLRGAEVDLARREDGPRETDL